MVFFKSTNGGRSWSTSQFFIFDSFSPRDIAISATNPAVIYVAGIKKVGQYYGGALLTSTDGGQSWTDISSNLNTERYHYFRSIVIDPTDDGKVYVGGSYLYRGTRIGHNAGFTWTRIQAPLNIDTLGIDPVDPSRIYAAGYESVAASTDYGQSWTLRSISMKRDAEHIAVAAASTSHRTSAQAGAQPIMAFTRHVSAP
jgi:hypothetical protein